MPTTTDQELSVLTIRDGQVNFDQEQKKALVDVLRVRHATDADLMVFFHLCRRTRLDPFRRQIYCIARQEWDSEANQKVWRQTYQTGIDGYRVIAEDVAQRRQVQLKKARFEYWDSEGNRTDVWWKAEPPAMIRATVQLGDDDPVIWDARYTEYVPLKDEYEPDSVNDRGQKIKGKKTGNKIPQGMWATRPTAQLEKCAEAGALRRACPGDYGNLYVDAEMERAEQPITTMVNDGSAPPEEQSPARDWRQEIAEATADEQLREIWRAVSARGERSKAIEDQFHAKILELQKAKAESEAATAPEPSTDEPPQDGGSEVPVESPAEQEPETTGPEPDAPEPVTEPDPGPDPWTTRGPAAPEPEQ